MTQGKSDTSWNAVHYDERMGFVSRLGKGLVDMLNQQAGERILDLGCGTGDLMYEISLLGADCVGLDSSETMLEKARRKYPGLRFFHADGHTFRLPEEVPFDAVFSNAALHWMNRPEEAVVSIGKCLRSGGRLIAEFGGKGNVDRVVRTLMEVLEELGVDAEVRYPWYFPSIGEYAGLLERHGFEVRYAELYPRPTPLDDGERGLRHWLDAFAGKLLEGLDAPGREKAYSLCEERLRPDLFDGEQWTADYRRLRVAAVKL